MTPLKNHETTLASEGSQRDGVQSAISDPAVEAAASTATVKDVTPGVVSGDTQTHQDVWFSSIIIHNPTGVGAIVTKSPGSKKKKKD